MEFYKNVGKALILFNIISIFFLILTIFAYSMIQYMFQPLVSLSNQLFSDPAVVNSLIKILDLVMVMPKMLDYAFLLLILVLVFDLLVFAWKTDTGSILNTMAFTLIGLPVWVYLMGYVTEFKNWALDFLGSAITYNVNLRFYTFIQNNSMELSIYLFMLVIAIRTIPWGNVKEYTSGLVKKKDSPSEDRNLDEILKQ